MATSTASDTQPKDPLLGKTVGGRYVIERLIGRGGVGLVYLADDTDTGGGRPGQVKGGIPVRSSRKVVVKVLAPHWAEDRDAVVRFDREALRMAKLDHPNVVRMYDHGHFEGRAYIVMEFIRGEPLRGYLSRRKRLPFEELVPIAAQILQGAAYVHERGIMMRDIKPPNIMLSEHEGKANHVKLLDFGLAKLIEEDDDDDVTKAHVIGTAAYMSPEQIRGDKIDVRVDVYALGVLFFLMLTGEQPIAGDNDAAVLVNHVHGVPKSLAERLPKGHRVPPELIALIESCLAKDPDDRPADAGAMLKRLREIVPAPLLEPPAANAKTRAAAETYWSSRLTSGPAAAAALESDGNDSAEWTRPLLRRAAELGQAPLKLAEAEVAAQLRRQQAANAPFEATAGAGAVPQGKPQPTTGSGALARPTPPRPTTGSGALARPTPPPRPTTGSGALARPTPPPRPTTGSGALARPTPPPRPPVGAGALARPTPPPRPPMGAGALARPTSPPPKPPKPPASAMASPPSSATIRVTAADAKEAVAKLEEELDAARSDRRTLVPTTAPARPSAPALDPAESASDVVKTGRHVSVPSLGAAELDPDAERSDALAIALDDDDDDADRERPSRPSEAIAPTAPNDPVATDALPVMPSVAVPIAPARGNDGMRWGAIVAVAGLAALTLGGLSAYLMLGGGDAPSPAAPSAPAEAVPVAAGAPSAKTEPSAPATSGTVEVRAIAGARVEVDGVDRGETPATLELAVGEHRVKVLAPGHHPWQTTIDVKGGIHAAVTAEPVPMEPAALELSDAEAPPAAAKGPEGKRPRPATGKPKPEAKGDSEGKPTPKPKPDVFLDSSKGKDDGIFLPVGGK